MSFCSVSSKLLFPLSLAQLACGTVLQSNLLYELLFFFSSRAIQFIS